MTEPTNTEILEAVTQGFAKVEQRLDAVELCLDAMGSKLEVLEVQHRDLRLLIDQIPDKIELTYGRMLNEHEDRIRVLEPASSH